jgi:hypothetical protein
MRGITMLGLLKLIALIGVVGWLIIGAGWWFISGFWRAMHTDFAQLPSGEAFERLFHRTPPAGVSKARSSGEIWLGGANVWMRFQATPQAVHAITRRMQTLEGWKDLKEQTEDSYLKDRHTAPFLCCIHWEEALQIQRPVCYCEDRAGSSVTVIHDPERQTAYVFYWSQ